VANTGNGRLYDVIQQVGYPPASPVTEILLFSGGRDSTCAAIRLYAQGRAPLLLTVIDTPTQSHDLTQQRVDELRANVRKDISWLSIQAPDFYQRMLRLPVTNTPSCLGCFFVRLSVAVVLSRKHRLDSIAAGFTTYQSSWIEQSATAIEGISAFLKEYGLAFSLPVHDVASKEEAKALLEGHGLVSDSLEPRCHCADAGTKTNGEPSEIITDIATIAAPCRQFIAECLSQENIA